MRCEQFFTARQAIFSKSNAASLYAGNNRPICRCSFSVVSHFLERYYDIFNYTHILCVQYMKINKEILQYHKNI